MKKSFLVTLMLSLILFLSTWPAAGATLFGPKQYTRITGPPNLYTDSLEGTPGDAVLVVKNGKWDGTQRVEDPVSSASVALNGEEIFGPSDFKKNIYLMEASVTLTADNVLEVELSSTPGSYISVEVQQEAEAPAVAISADPESILIGASTTLAWDSTHAETATIDQGIGNVSVNGSMKVFPTATTTYTIDVTGTGGEAADAVTVTVVHPPTASIQADPAGIQSGQSSLLSWHATHAGSCVIEPDIGNVDLSGSTAVAPTETTIYTITAAGPGGIAMDQTVVTVTAGREPQPEGSFGARYEDLIPPDATAEAYDPRRFSLITGLVHSADDLPLSDVSVSIHNHPEYGTVFTDVNGRFSIPVQGGGTMTLVYEGEGRITAHRKIPVSWNDIAIADVIHMIAEDTASTTVTFDGEPNTVFTHRSSQVMDEFGARSCTMVFTGDNHAYEVSPHGEIIRPLATITTRATEFATPESMPAELPANSAYTYCVELSVDGTERVRFEKPITIWVDNFLGFDVGEPVPVGYYDRDRASLECLEDRGGEWVPSDNGVVVTLLDTDADGVVDALDADGDGQADDLNQDGFSSDEVAGLHDDARYTPGSTFWRFEVDHFTPVDLNWPWKWPWDGVYPDGLPRADQQSVKPCCVPTGSFTESRSRILHEDIPIPGTDIRLHYASNRVEGYRTVITVPASGDSVPASLKRIALQVDVAGQTLASVLDPLPNQIAEFEWNGLDHLGRRVSGSTTAHVSVGFVYDAAYLSAGDFQKAFGQPGDDGTGIRARQEVTRWKRSALTVSGRSSAIAEGWTVSTHHHLDTVGNHILTKGDGSLVTKDVGTIETVAGNGSWVYGGDSGPATEAGIADAYGVVLDAGGNLYISDTYDYRIRKVDADGTITTIVGDGAAGFSGDNGPAKYARLDLPWGIAVDGAGNLYIADSGNHRVRKVDPCGMITTVAGSGPAGYGNEAYSGDGGPATQARLAYPRDVFVDSAGNLFIADAGNGCVRKVDTGGMITTVAGTGASGEHGDGGPAMEAWLGEPYSIVADTAGNLYISDAWNNRVRKVDPSGIITTIAGNGDFGYGGDGGLATAAQLGYPGGLSVDGAGNLYISDAWNMRIRKVDTSGFITTVAGTGIEGYNGDGGAATQSRLYWPADVTIDAAGDLYIADSWNYRVRKVPLASMLGQMSPGDILFAEENIGHIFSSGGRHESTVELHTGAVLRKFHYDGDSRLVSITDRFGNQTTIQRNGNGVPTSMTSPHGLMTGLTVDANNHLIVITYPDDNSYRFEYTPEGLMTAKVEPEGNRFDHRFDASGRLTEAFDDEGGHWQFSRFADCDGNILTLVATAEGNLTSYADYTDSTGAYTSTITDPSGAETVFLRSAKGLDVCKSLPCGTVLSFAYALDPVYKFKYVRRMSESTPSGLERVIVRNKTYEDTNSDGVTDLITERVTCNGKTAGIENNVLQAQKTFTSPESRWVSTFYDPASLLTTSLSIPGFYQTSYGYDPEGRLTSIGTNTRETVFSYNLEGFLASVTDPLNHTTTYGYNAVGRMTSIDRPDGTSLRFDYDRNGNMTVLTVPSTVEHGFGYDGVNLNRSYETPLSGSYSYVYDRDRRLIQTNFPSGKKINNIYDKNRLTQIRTPEDDIELSYLCGTKVESISNDAGAITYGYDGKLVTSETLSGTLNQSLSYTYNNHFNIIGFTYAGGSHQLSYDADGLLTGAGMFTIDRNAYNGLPEGVTGGPLNLTRTFNAYGEVAGHDLNVAGLNLASWHLTRDDNGRITHKTETVDDEGISRAYTYDSMGRLLTVTESGALVEEYRYDARGTRSYEMNVLRGISGRSFTYSDEDHLLTAGPATYQYDPDGFLAVRTDGSGDTLYNYSLRGELLSVALPDGKLIEYIHDPLGRRTAKKVDGAVTEKYLWQGLTRLLAVYDAGDGLLMRFEYADGRMPVAMTKDESTYYMTYDQVGSLRLVADAHGHVIKKVDYDSFGNIINDSVSSFEVPFGFAGGLHDRDTGLVRFGCRDYDPDVGRWTAKDPIRFLGGDTDLYGYCVNAPTNWSDPLGIWTEEGHWDLTRLAMKALGFTESDIASASQANAKVDSLANQFNAPAHYMPGTHDAAEDLINTQLNKAVQLECEGQHEAAMATLGGALHTIQDMWAHAMQDAGWSDHFLWVGTDPDNPEKHPFEYARALSATERLLETFKTRVADPCR